MKKPNLRKPVDKVLTTAKRRHTHFVIVAGVIASISIICFGFEMLGLATATGVIGTLILVLADL